MKNLCILYPTDFSELSKDTLRKIIPHIKRGKNTLRLVHAASHAKKSEEADRVKIRESFSRFEESIPELLEVEYTKHWEFGLSKEVILKESDKVEVDMIIMPTRGATGIEGIWGSKTEAVVRDAIVPVIVLPEGASLDNIDKIALAADYDDISCDYRLDPLLQLADHLKTEIDVVTINRDEHTLTRKEKINRKRLKYRLMRFPHRFSYHFEPEISEGLINYARKNNAQLIAIMPRDFRFLQSLFTESLSRRMVYRSSIPLLILP